MVTNKNNVYAYIPIRGESEVTQLCPTLSNLDCSLPGSSVHEIFQARVLGWVAIAFSTRFANLIHKRLTSTREGEEITGSRVRDHYLSRKFWS